jgi:hypothetical protein
MKKSYVQSSNTVFGIRIRVYPNNFWLDPEKTISVPDPGRPEMQADKIHNFSKNA